MGKLLKGCILVIYSTKEGEKTEEKKLRAD